MKQIAAVLFSALILAGCSSREAEPAGFSDRDVSFEADGLTIHGSYRNDGEPGPAALLISESGNTDRNGDNAVAGPVGNMRQLADALSDRGVSSLRYDKIGTGKTGLGPYRDRPMEVVSAVYTTGADAALRYLADQPSTDKGRVSVYALGEGTIHAMSVAGADDPKVHSLGLFQPLPGRYLDIITSRVRANGSPEAMATWLAAVEQIRTKGTAPTDLPEGLSALVNPGNLTAVIAADRIDPVQLAATLPDGMPVLLTCSDSDGQAPCDAERPLIDALGHTALTVVELKGVNHVLRDDPTDNVANYANGDPLSSQVLDALNGFVDK